MGGLLVFDYLGLIIIVVLAGAVCGIVAVCLLPALFRRIRSLEASNRDLAQKVGALTRALDEERVRPPAPNAAKPKEEEPLTSPILPEAPRPPALRAWQQPLPAPPAEPPTPPVSETPPAPRAPAPPAPARLKRVVLPPSAPPRPAPAAQKTQRPPRESIALEKFVGTRLLGWVGAVVVLFAVAFFFGYAIKRGWIDEAMRLTIGISFGMLLLIAGVLFRRSKLPIIAQTVTGAGFATLYISAYFAFQVYGLWPQGVSFAVAAGVTFLAIGSALKDDSIPICVLALIGGYLSPVLLPMREDQAVFLFTYIAIVNLAVMVCGVFRNWRGINALAFIGTVALAIHWYVTLYEPGKLPIALAFLSVYFVTFLVVPALRGLIRKSPADPEQLLRALVNTALALGAYGTLLYSDHRLALGLTVFGQSAALFALFATGWMRVPSDRRGAQFHLTLACSLTLIAIPITFRDYNTAVAWAGAGGLLALAARRFCNLASSLFALLALALAGVGLSLQLPLHSGPFQAVWNHAFGAWALVAALGGTAAWLMTEPARSLHRFGEMPRGSPADLSWFLCLGIACTLLHMETDAFWRMFARWGQPGAEAHRVESLVALWALIAVAAAVLGRLGRVLAVRWLSFLVLALGFVVVMALAKQYHPTYSWLFLNLRFGAGLALAAACGIVASAARKPAEGERSDQTDLRRALSQITLIAGIGFGALMLHLDVAGFWNARAGWEAMQEHRAESLVGLWAIMASLTAAWGWARQSGTIQACSVILLGIGFSVLTKEWENYDPPYADLFINLRVAAGLGFAAACGVVAGFLRRPHAQEREQTANLRQLSKIILISGIALGAAVLHLDIRAFWTARAGPLDARLLAAHRAESLVTLWALLAPALAWVALRRRVAWLGWLAVAAQTAGLIVWVSTLHHYTSDAWLALNSAFGARGLFVLTLWGCVALLGRLRRQEGPDRTVRRILESVGHLLFVTLLAKEVYRWGSVAEGVAPEFAQGAVSAVWSAYALFLIGFGLYSSDRLRRMLGFALFAVAVGKVFLLDMQELDPIYRILSFGGTGLLLLAACYFYNKYSHLLTPPKKDD